LIAAPVAEWVGLQVWYWAGGALVMIVGVLSYFVREVSELENIKPSIQAAVVAAEANA
jgi:hypothetical protein